MLKGFFSRYRKHLRCFSTTLEQASIYTPIWGMTPIITSYRQEGRIVHFHPRCDTKTLELRKVAQIAQKVRPELNFASAKYETHDLFRIEMITILFLLYIRIEKNRIQKRYTMISQSFGKTLAPAAISINSTLSAAAILPKIGTEIIFIPLLE